MESSGRAASRLPAATERRLREELRRFQIPWAIMVAACLSFAGLGALLPAPGWHAAAGDEPRISLLLVVAAVLCAGSIFVLERKLVAPAVLAEQLPPNDVDIALRHLLAGHLVLWSLIAVLPILGFAQLLLGGRAAFHHLLCSLAVGILAYLMPSRKRIAVRIAAILR